MPNSIGLEVAECSGWGLVLGIPKPTLIVRCLYVVAQIDFPKQEPNRRMAGTRNDNGPAAETLKPDSSHSNEPIAEAFFELYPLE